MEVYKDVLTNDEMLTNQIEMKLEYEDAIIKASSKYITVGDEQFNIGSPDPEEPEVPDDAPQGEKKPNVVVYGNLQPYQMSKKEYMSYIKGYFAKIVKYLEEHDKKDRVETFKKGATAFTKFIIPKFDDVELFVGAGHSDDDDEVKGMVVIQYWEDDSAPGPVFYFFADGLIKEKY